MRILGRIRVVKIVLEFFRFRSLFNGRGLDDLKGFQSLSPAREGDGCMKDTDHLIRHPEVHLADLASALKRRDCA